MQTRCSPSYGGGLQAVLAVAAWCVLGARVWAQHERFLLEQATPCQLLPTAVHSKVAELLSSAVHKTSRARQWFPFAVGPTELHWGTAQPVGTVTPHRRRCFPGDSEREVVLKNRHAECSEYREGGVVYRAGICCIALRFIFSVLCRNHVIAVWVLNCLFRLWKAKMVEVDVLVYKKSLRILILQMPLLFSHSKYWE